MYLLVKRVIDIVVSMVLAGVLIIPILIIFTILKVTSKDSAIYYSDRIGKNNHIFKMPKFRTMKSGAPEIATHLMKNADKHTTKIGKFLRKTSLDELPQLWSVIKGDMALVGPRPALYNQYDLIKLRTSNGVEKLTPGITGWAQINGRDEISIEQKVQFDTEYLVRQSILFDFEILFKTFMHIALRRNISH
jgi:O-antigen biosynthesis protein WbqP